MGHNWEIQSQKGLCWRCEQDAASTWGLAGFSCSLAGEAGQTSVTSLFKGQTLFSTGKSPAEVLTTIESSSCGRRVEKEALGNTVIAGATALPADKYMLFCGAFPLLLGRDYPHVPL